ncbi:restriction endonuclease subunit S [Geodermatophilus sp. SYSU D00742]
MSLFDRVPVGWSQKPLWSMFVREKDVGHPKETMLSVFREHGVVEKDSRANLNVTAEDRNIYQLVDEGWLVVNRMKAWQGSVGISPHRGIVSGHYLCFRPRHGESPHYLNWLLRSTPYIAEYQKLSRGVRPGQAEIDNDLLRTTPVLLPPLEDQRRIAEFLDHQVGRIGRAVELRSQQSALLDARTSRTLQDRLDQASGGDVVPLGVAASVIDTEHRTAPIAEGTGLWIAGTSAVRDGQIRPELMFETDEDSFRQWTRRGLPRAGDLLLTREAPVGEVALLSEDSPRLAIGQRVVVLRPGPRALPKFLLAVLMSPSVRRFYDLVTQGSLHPHLNNSDIRRIPVPAVHPDEQFELATELDLLVASARAGREAMSRSIELLRQRQQALVTAAVTGQFDVTTARAVA